MESLLPLLSLLDDEEGGGVMLQMLTIMGEIMAAIQALSMAVEENQRKLDLLLRLHGSVPEQCGTGA